MKKYTAIIKTRTDCIDNNGNVRSRTYKYEADRLRDIYKQAEIDTCDYNGISYAFVYDKLGRVVKQIVSIGREIAVYAEIDNEEQHDAAELYAEHKEDEVITL